MYREKRDYEKELASTLNDLKQEINSVRKQLRELRLEKTARMHEMSLKGQDVQMEDLSAAASKEEQQRSEKNRI